MLEVAVSGMRAAAESEVGTGRAARLHTNQEVAYPTGTSRIPGDFVQGRGQYIAGTEVAETLVAEAREFRRQQHHGTVVADGGDRVEFPWQYGVGRPGQGRRRVPQGPFDFPDVNAGP